MGLGFFDGAACAGMATRVRKYQDAEENTQPLILYPHVVSRSAMRHEVAQPVMDSMLRISLANNRCSDLWLSSRPAIHKGCMALFRQPWCGFVREMPQIRFACQIADPLTPGSGVIPRGIELRRRIEAV